MTPGKVRGLDQASTEAGVFSVFAIDHRDSMRVVLDPDEPESVPDAVLTDLKLEFTQALAHDASAILLDPEYSAIQAVERRAIPGSTGMLCAVEAQGYLGDPNARETSLLDGWGVAQAKRLGASGVKLLLLYRPDSEVAASQEALVESVVAACADEDLPLFLEPVMYQLDTPETPGTAQFGDDRRHIVCESARRLGALGPDVLKMQFPADTTTDPDLGLWSDACQELDEASPVPWTLLSGGDPYASFVTQVEVACDAGASGFLVGRAVWGDAITLDDDARRNQIESDVRPRFRDLAAIANDRATPWFEHRSVTTTTTGYRDYVR